MGLDITAFQKLILVHESEHYDESLDDDGLRYFSQAEGVPSRSDGMPAGFYKAEGEMVSFRAGSYSGYGAWREWLAKTFLGVDAREIWDDPGRFAGKPFVELINYSDCDGFIGPKTSAKLAADFAAHKPPAGPDPFYADRYAMWRRAFELAASDGGVVDLH